MPLYEYECDACSKRFEVIQRFSDAPPETCRVCGKGPVRRLMSSPAIQFKGTGWYITDYAKKGKSEDKSGSENGSGAAKAEGKESGSTAAASDSSSSSTSNTSTTSTPAAPTKSE